LTYVATFVIPVSFLSLFLLFFCWMCDMCKIHLLQLPRKLQLGEVLEFKLSDGRVASYTVPDNDQLSNKKNKSSRSSRSEVLKRLAGKDIQIPVPIIPSQEIGNELLGSPRKDYDDDDDASSIIEDGEDGDNEDVEEVLALESQQGIGTKSEIVKLRAKLVKYESEYPKGDSRTTKLKKILKSLQRVNCDN
jgi:hypothetical protein